MKRLGFMGGVSAAIAGLASPGFAQVSDRYTAGATPIEGDSIIFLAQSQGYFARAGVNVEVSTMSSGAAIAAAIVSGQVTIGSINTISLAIAHQNGVKLKIVAPGVLYDSRAPVAKLFVLKASPVRRALDLTNKTVAVNVLGGSSQIGVQAWVDANGGSSPTVRWVEMPYSSMLAALTANRVDAAVLGEPAMSAASESARALAAPYDAIASSWLVTTYVASEDWFKLHPDVAKRMQTALKQTAAWMNANSQQSAAAIIGITKQDPAEFARSTHAHFGDVADSSLLQPAIDVAARYHVLKSAFPASELL
jgi:NitT/TauT family transport system substrate-binding protein